MKLLSIELSQASRLVRFHREQGGVFWPDAVAKLRDRYSFLRVPNAPEEFDLSKGVRFNHGKFRSSTGQITIDLFQYWPNGVLAQSNATVEATSEFLRDLVEFTAKEWGFELMGENPSHFCESHLVVQSEIDLCALVTVPKIIADTINAEMVKRGFPHQYITSRFDLHFDPVQFRRPVFPTFAIERRIQEPFTANQFWTRAPLPTRDHLVLLESLERLA